MNIPFTLQGVENTLAKEGKFSSAVAHTFNQFQLVHFPLNQAVVLRERESCHNGCFVTLNSCDKAAFVRGSDSH
jgi:hypothetical protein